MKLRLVIILTLLLAPLFLLRTVWRVIGDDGNMNVINGSLDLHPAGWLEVVATAVWWTAAVVYARSVCYHVEGKTAWRVALVVGITTLIADPMLHWFDPLPTFARFLLKDVLLIGLAYLQVRLISSDFEKVESSSPARGPGGWRIVAVAAAAAVPAAVAALVAGTVSMPAVQVTGLDEGVDSVAWPAGRHPVIVTGTSIVDCLDARCARLRRTPLHTVPFAPLP